MKVLTILGTRPEIIRLSRILPKLDKVCEHRLLHTGQNYDPLLNDIFFKELKLRTPDIILNSKGTLAQQLASMFIGVENELIENRPDKILILGDTNSGLCSIIAERMGIPVYHMEAGNRCFDLRVPEEINRRIIDHTATYNLPYVVGSRENLLNEGLSKNKILETGNPINEVLQYYSNNIEESNILEKLNINSEEYIFVTCHRAENVNSKERLGNIIEALMILSKKIKVIFSCHPKTKDRIKQFEIDTGHIDIIEPVGFFDCVKLEKNAKCVITESGTMLEELAILHKPVVTIRDSTERPEIVAIGRTLVSGVETGDILEAVEFVISAPVTHRYPEGYDVTNVSDIVVNFLMSKGQ